eukprot:2700246-Alexandrium_andersonii.AAC.1
MSLNVLRGAPRRRKRARAGASPEPCGSGGASTRARLRRRGVLRLLQHAGTFPIDCMLLQSMHGGLPRKPLRER